MSDVINGMKEYIKRCCVISIKLTQEGKGEPGITAKIVVIDYETGEIIDRETVYYEGTLLEAAGDMALNRAYDIARENGYMHVIKLSTNFR